MTREEFKDFCDMKVQLEPENEDIFKAIVKTLEQEPKTGHWILGGYDDNYYICDKCNYKASEYYIKPRYNFCPNCGADMREVEE